MQTAASAQRNLRHPEWYPVRPLAVSTTLARGILPAAAGEELLRELETVHAPDWVTRHDTSRRGVLPFSSFFDVKFQRSDDATPLDCCVFVDTAVLPGSEELRTAMEVSLYLSRQTPREDTPAARAGLEALRRPPSSAPPPPGMRLCQNPACAATHAGHLSRCKRCSSCRGAAYCSKRCQTQDWAAHRPACRVSVFVNSHESHDSIQ